MSELGRYRKLYARLWRQPGFARLSDGEKVLALYLLTGPQTNRLGLYVLSIATAAEELRTVPQTITKRLVNVCDTFGWLFDKDSRVIYLPSFWKWNPPENVNVMKGSLRDLNEIPPCRLVEKFARNIETLPATLHETFLEGLRQRLPGGYRIQEQEQEQEQEQKQEQKQEQEQEQEQTALRAGAERRPTIDGRLLEIARATRRDAPRESSTEYLTDHFLDLCRREHVTADKALAVRALTQAHDNRVMSAGQLSGPLSGLSGSEEERDGRT